MIAALLAIADSRFQQALAEQAQSAGKLPKDFVLPERYRNNTPERLQTLHQAHAAALPEFPWAAISTGRAGPAAGAGLAQRKLKLSEILELGKATLDAPKPEAYPAHLRRMDLDDPQGFARNSTSACCWPACEPARKSRAEWRSVEELDLTAGQRFHPGQGLDPVAFAFQQGAAILEGFLDDDAEPGDARAGLADQVDQRLGGMAVGEESSITSTWSWAFRCLAEMAMVLSVCLVKENTLEMYRLSLQGQRLVLAGEDHRDAQLQAGHDRRGDAGSLDGDDLGDALVAEAHGERVTDLLHQLRVDLVVEKGVDLEYVLGKDDAFRADFVFENVHGWLPAKRLSLMKRGIVPPAGAARRSLGRANMIERSGIPRLPGAAPWQAGRAAAGSFQQVVHQ